LKDEVKQKIEYIYKQSNENINNRLSNENRNKSLERELQKRKIEEEESQKFKFKPDVPINSVLLAEKNRKENKRDTSKPIYEQLIN